MKDYVCEVVPVYVRPQPITDEKACVGVIVRCPEADIATYRLVEQGNASFERIAQFFPRLGRENLKRALEWSKNDIEFSFASEDRKLVEKRFANLIRPRENVVQYGSPQIHVTQSPQEEVERIYHNLVA